MTALLLGFAFGAGLWLIRLGLRPRPEPLGVAISRLDYEATPPVTLDRHAQLTWDERVGVVALQHLNPLRLRVHQARSRLRLAGRSPEEQAARTVLYATFGLFLGAWLAMVSWIAGAMLPTTLIGAVSLTGAAIGVLAPWLSVRAEVEQRRRDFLLSLAAWCDMVAMTLAAGRGIEQAVTTAATTGEGWAFAEIRAALSAGNVRGETPWAALEALGSELGVQDVRELAGTISMAGEDGAAIREAVATKSRTLRERICSDIERDAERSTAEMGMPTFAIAFGFLVFLGYPALDALSQSGL